MVARKIVKLLLVMLCVGFMLSGCGKKTDTSNVIRVGTIAGPDVELMQVVKKVARDDYGLDVEVVVFQDYNQPNAALADGQIDANVFQHDPFLKEDMKAHGYHLASIAKTFIYPMGIYSKRYDDLGEIDDGETIALPDDPSNQARALLLMQQAGLITLKNGGSITSTLTDIVDNPYDLQFKLMKANDLVSVLPNVGLAVINANFAVEAGLYPNRDALYMEDQDSPYANVVVVRASDRNNQNVQYLVDALHSPEVEDAAQRIFHGQVIEAW
ncbi:MAG: MetQ/NlpA family ABC transporter substrate-binding protein [Gammaproteobacteria bacterium]